MIAVVLLGPPGAGKGTVAEVFESSGYKHISTGALLREQIRLGTPEGAQAKALIDHGQFAPDEMIISMIQHLLESVGVDEKVLFDGFPRTLPQAEMFDELIKTVGGYIEDVVLLECPDKVILERLGGRRTCATCGSIYHVTYNPSNTKNLCDRDDCQLELRPDDEVNTVRKRLLVYQERTAPLISYYHNKNLITSIDASQSIQQVRESVFKELG
jgi:adenylate kinase